MDVTPQRARPSPRWQRATRISLCWLLLSSGWLSYQCAAPVTPPTEKNEQLTESRQETPPTPEIPPGDKLPDAATPDASEPTSEPPEVAMETTSEPAPPESAPPETQQPQTTQQLEQFFQQHGGRSAFTSHYVDALTTFLTVEDLYFAGKYSEGKQKLDAIFQKYPHSDPRWYQAKSDAHGTNVGNPVAYYGLRMLQEMIDFRLATPNPSGSSSITLTVLLVDCLKGVQPTTMKELQDGTGKEVQLNLTPAVKENGHAVIKQSLRLFREYIFAITKGKLKVDIGFQDVNTCARGVVRAEPYRTAGLAQSSEIYTHVPDEVKQKTSWWWVLYPSMVPAQYPDFKTTEFITGGMGVSLRGAPEFISDDQWLVRKPPHLGTGPYTEIERRVYLPQWLQHEFFHHLFRSYPEFGLENSSHQWFDRSKWPSDFVGSFEPDYYAEALKKRLQTAQPPLHAKLRYDAPPDSLNTQIQEKDFLGHYQRKPVANDYHDGQILKDSGGKYIWKNKAGVSWALTFTPGKPGLQTDASCPYYGKPLADYFLWQFQRDQDGNYTTGLTGFSFLGEIYQKVP